MVVTKHVPEVIPADVVLLRKCSGLLKSLASNLMIQSLFINSMLDNNARGLRLLVQLLDVASSDSETQKNVNTVLFAMASNVQMLATILDFVANQAGGNLTTQRWLITMLAMLSSEKEWMEEVFLTDESLHPISRNTNYTRDISVPLASKLLITFDKKCSTEQGKQVLTITSDTMERKFSGSDPSGWAPVEIEGARFKLEFASEADKAAWGYRLYVKPSFQDMVFEGRQNIPDIIKSQGLKLVLQSLEADDELIQLMASRALANMLFVTVRHARTSLSVFN
jgi:hypothetical protein